MALLDDLQARVLIADGAMGTLLYSYGVGHCYEELNISQPEQIQAIHQAYLDAGAQVIQTNTYAANYAKLSRYGLEDMVKEINVHAVRLAKAAANGRAYVLGTIGGIRGAGRKATPLEEIKRSFREQLFWLLQEEPDGLILETYYDLEELSTVLQIARKETPLPIIAQVSLHEAGVLQGGIPLSEALNQLEELGADVIGVNCRLGPHHMLRSLEQVPLPRRAYLSAYPNASLLNYVDGRLIYQSEPDYFAQQARAIVEQGVRLIGGCCGTTPAHIQAMAGALKDVKPVTEKEVQPQLVQIEEISLPPGPPGHKEQLQDVVAERKSVIVELDPPKHLDTGRFMEGASALKQAGIDALTMADNSLATPRISNMAMAALIQQQLGVRPLVHVTCRDRNLIGLQSHLLGLYCLGIDHVLAVTGDPTKIGDFPGATSVYDLSSIELIQLIKQMNEGLSFSGKPLKRKTSFSVAAAFNPNVRHLERAVARLEKKIEAGADYFISQPVYDHAHLHEIYEATKHLPVPIYIGIMPLTSSRNAEFLHHEVPGIKLTDEIRQRMAAVAHDPRLSQQEGLAIAKALIDTAYKLFNGIYLITPFMRYEISVELVNYIHAKQQTGKERELSHGRHIV
ncbi:homocysteine S-methyltransferase [Caldalkalibacillus thermarum TA2.A1]|uniref:Homocysteine S-methyltransferase n=1 Tax=Caldalkalibacillus thermarum (strain TA2.A1) TaxID=986075 RepID=F5L7C1_CALTT|nr:bifunctional homocysteine S-methyltransferase/methylenetetrahydrofolate reductase [Caldalkalibacillus thermarum]EGL82782.1 homocysteine S-methyltransferase [Caldalkalibacillus thermarum TA2.A1]